MTTQQDLNHPDTIAVTWRRSSWMPFFIIISLAVLNLAVSILAAQAIIYRHRIFHDSEMAEAARMDLGLARALVKTSPDRQMLRKSIDSAIRLGGDPEACIAIISNEGTLVAGLDRCRHFDTTGGETWHALPGPNQHRTWYISAQEGPYRIVVSRDLNDRDSDLSFIFLMAIVATIAATIGQFLLWRALNRVHVSRVSDIAASARRMSGGDLSERISTKNRHDSYLVLAVALNDIAERFQTQAEAMRIANNAAAHDLRMPLTRVLNSLQRMIDHREISPRIASMVERSQEEVERAMSQFMALNTLARLETGISLDTMEIVDLSSVVTTACELFDPVLEDAGILLDVKVTSLQVRAQIQLLTQAIANLLQNASKYAGPGALVTVTCRQSGDTAEIVVADNGPGVPEEDLERVIERYVRLDPSRSTEGFGLGLSMVAAVAKLHGGSFTLENDSGLRCTISLPINR
jgi:signal transduction histidine kinase